MYCSRSLVW